MNISDRIKIALAHNGKRAKDLAVSLGVSPQVINNAIGRAGSKHLPAIANALGVSVEWLTNGDPAHAPSWAGMPDALAVHIAQIIGMSAEAVRAIGSHPGGQIYLMNLLKSTLAPPLQPMPEDRVSSIAQLFGLAPVDIHRWGSNQSGRDQMLFTLSHVINHDEELKKRVKAKIADLNPFVPLAGDVSQPDKS